jgi:hypothetical protein
MASLAGLYNNHSMGVINNRNNSSGTALAGDQVNLLGNNNNNANPQEDLVEIVQRELSKAMAARDIQLR